MNPLDIQLPKPATPLKRMVSIEDLWKTFTKMRGFLAPSTLKSYQLYGRRFCNFILGDEKPLTSETMIAWVAHQQSLKISPNKINHCNTIIRSFMRFLKSSGYIYEDLASAIPKLKGTPLKDAKTFTNEEYERIKKYCTGRTWCQTQLWLIILGYRTGMSLVDCCHLRWENVTLNDNGPSYITIHRIKMVNRVGAGTRCHIPIVPGTDLHQWLLFLRDNVERYPRYDGINDYVHPDAPGLYNATISLIGQNFSKIFRLSGITDGKTFKHLRNSFCSNLINSETNVALICKMTGHSSVTTLLRYLKPDCKSLEDGLIKAFQYAALQSGTTKEPNGLTFEMATI